MSHYLMIGGAMELFFEMIKLTLFVVYMAGRHDLPSINLLELKATEVGLWLAIKTGVQKLWIEWDSTTAIAWVKGKGSRPWTAIRSLRSIQQGLLRLKEWKASHVLCEGNSPADLIASFQSTRGETILYPSTI
ncbi:hypothetical protein QJS04_geneDACA017986 [Acorus gramineus]|uniref:RNase H type-1 domain-containing protein n=1 Tax=Acorus gramineus TaxID=55184 RepID=A0AAV9A532_ACOGR|nr:hypothetical protein QJS04_geneDACA017986 [Acorus gramineus]